MADPERRDRSAKDIGAESPASEEVKEQSESGMRGAPRGAKQRGRDRQPAQTSGRRSERHEQRPEVRKRFDPEESPAAQGEGEASPERIKKGSAQQGIEPGSGSHSARGERTEEEAQRGPPHREHTRHGRQSKPGG